MKSSTSALPASDALDRLPGLDVAEFVDERIDCPRHVLLRYRAQGVARAHDGHVRVAARSRVVRFGLETGNRGRSPQVGRAPSPCAQHRDSLLGRRPPLGELECR